MKHEINVPEGCRVVSVETTDEMVVVKFEKEEPILKENDIIVIDESDICILKNKLSDCNFYNTKVYYDIKFDKLFNSNSTLSGNVRLATEDEKEILFDAMKKENLTFDGENILEAKPKFKENDVITCIDGCYKWIAIYKDEINETSFNAKVIYTIQNEMFEKNSWAVYANPRLATDSEKQLLFDKLKEKCLMFDGEDVVRWRADNGCRYFFVNAEGVVIPTTDENSASDRLRYNNGNYFPTSDIALSFQMKSLEFLTDFHKNFQQ